LKEEKGGVSGQGNFELREVYLGKGTKGSRKVWKGEKLSWGGGRFNMGGTRNSRNSEEMRRKHRLD